MCREGRWALEVEVRQVIMDGKVVRPTITWLDGADTIMARLGDFSHQLGLVEGIRDRLSRASGEQPDTTYEVDNGRWVTVRLGQGQEPEGIEGPNMRQTDGMSGSASVGQLDERLAHESERVQLLLARVEALERRVSHIEEHGAVGGAAGGAPATRLDVPGVAAAPGAQPGVSPAGVVQPAPVQEPSAVGAVGDDLPVDEPVASPVADSGSLDPSASEEPSDESAAEGAADPEDGFKPIVNLPETAGVFEILQMLVGDEVSVVKDNDELPGLTPETSMYYTYLLDDEDREVGAILFDMTAVVRLGGTMMMLPDDVLHQMQGSGNVTEEALDGCSEIMNNLSSLINTARGNPHVRTMPATPLDGSEPDWFHSPRERLDLLEQSQEARVVFISR